MAESKVKKRRSKQEYSRDAVKTLILFALFLALTCGTVMGAVMFLPVDLPASEPANTPGNLMNGGKTIIGDDRVYYTDSTGLYSFGNSTPDQQITLSDEPADQLFYKGGKIYYTQKGILYSAFFDGSLKTEIFAGFDEVQLSGNWIYYLRDGDLHKIKLDGTRDTELGLRPRQFYVMAQTVYYLGEDGKLYSARTDGSRNALFADVQADRFMINGNYLFYSNNQEIHSLNMADRQTGDRLGDGGLFQVNGAAFYYFRDGGLYFSDLSGKDVSAQSGESNVASGGKTPEEEPVKEKKLADTDGDALYLCGDYLYFSKANGAVSRVRSDGTELRQISQSTK